MKSSRSGMRMIIISIVLIFVTGVPVYEASRNIHCGRCGRLFYEFSFDLSLPCESSPLGQDNITATCVTLPATTVIPQAVPGNEESATNPSAITHLQLLELNANYEISGQEMFSGQFKTGHELFHESGAPGHVQGLQVIATAENADKTHSRISWIIFFADSLCHDSYLNVTLGWARTIIACERERETTPAPSFAPIPRTSQSRSRPASNRRVRRQRKGTLN